MVSEKVSADSQELPDLGFDVHETSRELAAISQWIDQSAGYVDLDPEAHIWRRITKIGSEHGEVIDAYAGAIGENPRKGVTNGMDAVLKELLDVATAALGAHEHLTGNRGNSIAALGGHIARVADRAGLVASWSGWALADRDALLAQVDRAGVVLEHEVVVCDHITLAYPDTSAPVPVRAAVVGVASDADVQALIVEIDGRYVRPDGNIYHVTLTRRADVPDSASKAMLLRAFAPETVAWLGRWSIPITPILRRTLSVSEGGRNV